jgi:hypothetical protein
VYLTKRRIGGAVCLLGLLALDGFVMINITNNIWLRFGLVAIISAIAGYMLKTIIAMPKD